MFHYLYVGGEDPTVAYGHIGWTALMDAAFGAKRWGSGAAHDQVIRWLLEDGRAPVDARTRHGLTALWWACLKGHTERFRLLLVEGGADHTVNDNGKTLVEMAQESCHRQGCLRVLQVRDCIQW